MKNFSTLILAIIMMLSFVSCGNYVQKTEIVETEISQPGTLNEDVPETDAQEEPEKVWAD